ncbi:MAG TPA: glycosyltransferase family 39 protein [Pyrinomonadaceae bacterium]
MKSNWLASSGERFSRLSGSIYLRLGLISFVFILAIVIRLFHWQDNPTPPFHGMTGEYKAHAMVLVRGDVKGFLAGPNPPSNAHVIKHPPGYPLLMALVYKLFGDNDSAMRVVHIVLDATAVVFVFLIANELFSFGTAILASVLAALSPQLAYHAVALLPDPLAAPTLLLAIYLLVRAYKQSCLVTVFAAGIAIGISCWFRSNTLLLPVFICATMPLLFPTGRRTRAVVALLAGFLLLVAPVTIRNAVYFHSFIPLSLSAGITLVEGIGVYDKEKKFGLPDSDYLVTKWEAEEFQRPDYLGDRFGVDGVIRERFRIHRGLAVIESHPLWFAGVMVQRAISMLRLARVELVRPQPAVRHDLTNFPNEAWTLSPAQAASGSSLGNLTLALSEAKQNLRIVATSGNTFILGRLPVKPASDYLLQLPLKIEEGQVVIEVIDDAKNITLAWTPILHPVNWLDLKPEEQPTSMVEVPFVSSQAQNVRLELKMTGKAGQEITVQIGSIRAYELGPATQTWTRYPRMIIHLLQKLFITAVALPCALLGIVLLVRRRRWAALVLLLVVPVYYMCLQSALWTEFRYILAMHYFLFILVSLGIVWLGQQVRRLVRLRS